MVSMNVHFDAEGGNAHLKQLLASCECAGSVVQGVALAAGLHGKPAVEAANVALRTALAQGSEQCKLSALWQYTLSFMSAATHLDGELVPLLRQGELQTSALPSHYSV